MNFFDFSFWQSFVSNLSATLIGAFIGVGLGIPAALWINRLIESKTEKERKKKILKVLLSEITENYYYLEIWKDKKFDFSKIQSLRLGIFPLCIDLFIESWDAFKNGGELEWIKEPIIIDTLATCYNKISAIKYIANKYLDFAYSDSKVIDQDTLEFVGSRLKRQVDDAIKILAVNKEILEFESKKIK
jgi:hypothetical protein